MNRILPMVDLKSQYQELKTEIDNAVLSALDEAQFINGEQVRIFQKSLENYLDVNHVIPCANGTDALQIALMALDLKRGDEVICPSFTYAATAEVVGLLGLKPVMADVDPFTFNLDCESVKSLITKKTRVIIPVHLYGQSCDMDPLMELADSYNLKIIEDNAQSLGALYQMKTGELRKTGTIGDIGSTSFFPSKNLGCYGDGGALFTKDDYLADKMRSIANHGQSKKYYHQYIGCNSRLDTIQAAILNVKLKYLDHFNRGRLKMAEYYDSRLSLIEEVEIPKRFEKSSHVYHQYTIKVKNDKRDDLQKFLKEKGIPAMIYYPLPLYKQQAFKPIIKKDVFFPVVEKLCKQVLSLPIHSNQNIHDQEYITDAILTFFKNN